MTVHLYTVCWDEADMLGFFFRHYDSWVDRYVIFDDGSTDGSIDLLKAHPKVELRRFERVRADSFVLSHTALQNEVWKISRGVADWVVITAIDEHLTVPGRSMAKYLKVCGAKGVTLIPALGFNMISDDFPEPNARLTDTVTRGKPDRTFNKLGIFNPAAITDTGFRVGRHSAQPRGEVRLPIHDILMLLHYKRLGFERTVQRQAEEGKRLGKTDVEGKMGTQYFDSWETQRAEWDEIHANSIDVTARTFDLAHSFERPRWWRPEDLAVGGLRSRR
jgi:hypothetical protein